MHFDTARITPFKLRSWLDYSTIRGQYLVSSKAWQPRFNFSQKW